MSEKREPNYFVCKWTDLETEYPERITHTANKRGVALGGERNTTKVGLGIFCGATMHHLGFRMENPWIPQLLADMLLFFMKPEHVKCWKKWLHYCWLELKEDTMLRTRQWIYVEWTHLWVIKDPEGNFLVWAEKDDFKDDIELISTAEDPATTVIGGVPFNEKDVKQYSWSDQENAYLPYTPIDMSDPSNFIALASMMVGSC